MFRARHERLLLLFRSVYLPNALNGKRNTHTNHTAQAAHNIDSVLIKQKVKNRKVCFWDVY